MAGEQIPVDPNQPEVSSSKPSHGWIPVGDGLYISEGLYIEKPDIPEGSNLEVTQGPSGAYRIKAGDN